MLRRLALEHLRQLCASEEEFLLTENRSTYIPMGVRHRLENPGRVPLEIIEVQSGTYLGEDDIVRFDDRYGRAEARTPVPVADARQERPAGARTNAASR